MKITTFNPFISTTHPDETYKLLREKGFKNLYGEETVSTGSSKAAMMVSPSGFNICIIQHIK